MPKIAEFNERSAFLGSRSTPIPRLAQKLIGITPIKSKSPARSKGPQAPWRKPIADFQFGSRFRYLARGPLLRAGLFGFDWASWIWVLAAPTGRHEKA